MISLYLRAEGVHYLRRLPLSLTAYARQRRGRLRAGRVEVLPQQPGHRRGYLPPSHFSSFSPSQRRRVRADHGNPDILGAGRVLAVVGPVDTRAAAAVVGRDDEGSLTLVLGE